MQPLRLLFALQRGQPLGVVEARGVEAVPQDHGARDHRPAQRPATHLVQPGHREETFGTRRVLEARAADDLHAPVHQGPASAPVWGRRRSETPS